MTTSDLSLQTIIISTVLSVMAGLQVWFEAKRKRDVAEAEAKRKLDAEAAKVLAEEAEAKRKRDAEEAKRLAEELEAKRVKDVEEAKRQQEAANVKLEVVAKKQDEIHTLVNSPFGITLKALADSYEENARRTRSEIDVVKAIRAREASAEHEAKQLVVNHAKQEDAEKLKAQIEAFLKGPNAQPAAEPK